MFYYTGTTREIKIGDRVRAIKATHGWSTVSLGDEGIVSELTFNRVKVDFSSYKRWNADPGDLELITNPTEVKDMDTYNKLKNLELDDDTRILREFNIENSEGEITETGRSVLLHMLYSEKRKAIVAKLRDAKTYDEGHKPKASK